jgi:HEPN domain-containing protein
MNRSQDWLKQAERDFVAAEVNRAAGLHEWAAFAAQQCAEKAVKALVQSLHGAERGHSVGGLLRQLPESLRPESPVMDAAQELDQIRFMSRPDIRTAWPRAAPRSTSARLRAGG